MAYLVRKAVPGIEIFGGIDLNRSVGGVNPKAVERMASDEGRLGPGGLDAHLRCRKSGAVLEREPAVRPGLEERPTPAGGEGGDRGRRHG